MSVSDRTFVILLCNDPGTGEPTGRFHSAVVGCRNRTASLLGRPVTTRAQDGWLRVGRVRAWYFSQCLRAGTACWGEWQVDPEGLAKIANYLRSRGWRCQSQDKAFARAWKKPGPITGEQLIAWGNGES